LLSDIQLDYKINKSTGFSDIYLNGSNLESKIKSLEVSNHVSSVAEIPQIRKHVVKIQKSFQHKEGLVMDGRDIGSVVFPNADLKLFLTASDHIRAKRRFDELINEGHEINYDDIFNNIISRDKKDSERKDSPLIIPKDAVVIDNSKMSIIDQLNFIIKLIKSRFNF
jgi:cytidylate kinase